MARRSDGSAMSRFTVVSEKGRNTQTRRRAYVRQLAVHVTARSRENHKIIDYLLDYSFFPQSLHPTLGWPMGSRDSRRLGAGTATRGGNSEPLCRGRAISARAETAKRRILRSPRPERTAVP